MIFMESTPNGSSFNTLRRFLRSRAPVERCELCSAELPREHRHLIDPKERKLVCSCDPCAILFSSGEGKYRRVPRQVRFLDNFTLSYQQWEDLLVPINMAFFFYSSAAGKVIALYPSPAGPTESLLPLEAWEEICAANPVLQKMEPDTEALLVNRVGLERGEKEAEYYLVPIDKCYELTGLIRANWQGLGGGAEVWREIARFFAQLKERAVNSPIDTGESTFA